MPFFQTSVRNKYLKQQSQPQLAEAYARFTAYFHNPERQQNIRAAKEEQFQEGFLRELFVNILGYTLNPEPNYNLTTELKNLVGSKKADGAILLPSPVGEGSGVRSALAVIELKGTDTTDLDKINAQAFAYKNNHPGCTYIITSNFEKLRFYIQNAVDHIEFNLFSLSADDFALLWLCLQVDNLLANIPLKAKEESLAAEENITRQLYKDYAGFKNDLWQNLVANHPEYNELELFKKTQKLIDRFLFIFFAEDGGLLPPNSISRMVERYHMLKDEDAYKPLYEIFKQYFGYINTGRKGKTAQDDIFAYNGGLFTHDDLLDTMRIDDAALLPHITNLTRYDFQSEVDVNILGHIFENSLNEIEAITARLEGNDLDSAKTKRKKDGVFYTPKYITHYIVQNTVGKLCEEKKAALGIVDEAYARGRSNRNKATIKALDDNLQAYRNWLLDITIVDPACGSGAFLNQALTFLMEEHAYVDALEGQLLGHAFEFPGVENHILERNLFGVDINEEAIDIARLSLWLRTAQRGRKLTTLSNNIKCGNSLISDPAVAGPKAFTWQTEFPQVFAKGGFDVVIGNPPYVTRNLTEVIKSELNRIFKTAQYQVDLYVSFMEKGSSILKSEGMISYIVPNSWLKNMMMSSCREFVLSDLDMITIIPSLENVFEGTSVDTMIFVAQKTKSRTGTNIFRFENSSVSFRHRVSQQRFFENEGFIFDVEVNESILPIMIKMTSGVKLVGDILDVIRGINPYDKYTGQDPVTISTRAYHAEYKRDETFVPELKGMHVGRYAYNWDGKHYISYGDWLAAPRPIEYFEGPRIVFREILGRTLVSTYIEEDFKIDRSLYIARLDNQLNEQFELKYVLGILNSALMAFYFRYSNNEFDNLFPKIRVGEFKKLPIKVSSLDVQKRMVELVNQLIESTSSGQTGIRNFIQLLQSKFDIPQPSTKLQNWPSLDFKGFLAELKKAKVKLTLPEEAEWLAYFTAQKEKATALQAEITRLDKEIDQMVYQLYGLSEEEIKIVESA